MRASLRDGFAGKEDTMKSYIRGAAIVVAVPRKLILGAKVVVTAICEAALAKLRHAAALLLAMAITCSGVLTFTSRQRYLDYRRRGLDMRQSTSMFLC